MLSVVRKVMPEHKKLNPFLNYPISVHYKNHPEYQTELASDGNIKFHFDWIEPGNQKTEFRSASNAGGELKGYLLKNNKVSCNGWKEWMVSETGKPIDSLRVSANSTPLQSSSDTLTVQTAPMISALNTILYGPPGTGKTYHTVEAAVKAADPEFTELKDRALLKARYDELVDAQRIRFVTFHQSFSYEEFVEGLRASSDKGEISYNVEPGIFRQICDDARSGAIDASDPLESALEDLKKRLTDGEDLQLTTSSGNPFKLEYSGTNTFQAFPSNSIHAEQKKPFAVAIRYLRELYRGEVESGFSCASYVKPVLAYLMGHYSLPEYRKTTATSTEQFVLIIDEINRGNISKIFGELITLLEPSKRTGQPEALSVQLPYSGDSFSIPDNLHIIGTMNTADRSLAMMDTALRRRFDFKEMMPNCELLDGVQVKGINAGNLLGVMNQRITYLYDREHSLGHAFFMPLTNIENDNERFTELQSIFKNKIVPLLEEYFFEDWEKIRLVLGDNQTSNPDEQFVTKTHVNLQALFGTQYQDDALDDSGTFQLNTNAFDNLEAYRKIAAAGS